MANGAVSVSLHFKNVILYTNATFLGGPALLANIMP